MPLERPGEIFSLNRVSQFTDKKRRAYATISEIISLWKSWKGKIFYEKVRQFIYIWVDGELYAA